MRFIRLETRGRETADKRTRDAPVQGTSLLFWTFVRGSGRWTASLPVWRLGCFRRRFVCGPIYRGKDRGARASRRPQPWGIRCRTRRQDAAPDVKKIKRAVPPILCGDTSPEKAREGWASSRWRERAIFSSACCREGHGQRGRQGYFLLRALWFRPRRPGSQTRRAGPADHASCLRADRPCGRDVPDIAPDPSPVPRAPAAGRRPGACPGAAAGRDGR